MFHTIEFRHDLVLDLQISWNKPLEKVSVCKGTRIEAQIKPYVAESTKGFVEVADLHFVDGTVTPMVPFACFCFVD